MMRKTGTAAVLLALVLALVACSGTASKWQEQYDLGIRCLEDGHYEEAVLAFTAAIEIDGKKPEAYAGRGDAYSGGAAEFAEQNDSDKALEWYRNAETDYQTAADLGDSTLEDKLADVRQRIQELEEAAAQKVRNDVLMKSMYDLLAAGDTDSALDLSQTDDCLALSETVTEGSMTYSEDGVSYAALYPDNFWYYGALDFDAQENGQRTGEAVWLTAGPEGKYVYEGPWVNDLPEGEGTLILTPAGDEELERWLYTSTKGTFHGGIYDGTFMETVHRADGTEETYPLTYEDGIIQPYDMPDWIYGYDYVEENLASGMFLISISDRRNDMWTNAEETSIVNSVFGLQRSDSETAGG